MNYRQFKRTTSLVPALKHLKSWFFVFGFWLGILGLTSCQSAIEEACQEFPQVQEELRLRLVQIEPFAPSPQKVAQTKVGGKAKRSPAQVSVKAPIAQVPTLDQKQELMDWTENLLKRTQWVRDGLETGTGSVREALGTLNDATLTLVSLHGWIEQGKMKKTKAGIERLLQQLDRAYVQGCTVKPTKLSQPKS